ncbi:hypothetical protein KAU33_12385 [Candidatus Dependentiae bacterium]|nr:hypothetical protein [Candidatus Dependentiae bacterium]
MTFHKKNIGLMFDFIYLFSGIFILLALIIKVTFNPLISAFAIFYFFLLMPGYSLVKIFKINISYPHEYFNLSFVIGLAVFSVFSTFFLVTEITFTKAIVLLTIFSISIFIFYKIKSREGFSYKKNYEQNFLNLFLITLMAIFWILIIIFKAPGTMDSLTTTSYISKLANSTRIILIDGFYSNRPYDIIWFNPWVVFNAIAAKISKVEYISLFSVFPILLMPLTVFSFFYFTEKVSGSSKIASISVIIFLLFHGLNEGLWIWRTSSYPMILTNFIIIPTLLGILFSKKNKNIMLWVAGLIIFLICAIHLISFFNIIVILFSILIINLIFNSKKSPNNSKSFFIVIVIGLVLSTILIFLLQRYNQHIGLSNQFHHVKYGILEISTNAFIVEPLKLFVPHYHVKPCFSTRYFYWFCTISVFLLIPYFKKSNSAKYSLTITFAALFIMLNPIITGILSNITSYAAIGRINQIIPYEFILGIVIVFYLNSFINHKNKRVFLEKIIVLLIFLTLFFGSLFVNKRLVRFFQSEKSTSSSIWKMDYVINGCLPLYLHNPKAYYPVLKFLRNIKEQSIIAAEPELSLFISSYTKHFVFLTVPNQSPIGAYDQIDRMEAYQSLKSKNSNSDIIKKILVEYEIDYLVLEKENSYLINKFENINYLKIIYNQDGYLVFKIIY